MYIVYGGSFNPPTKAHFNIVTNLLQVFSNSKVIILPVGNKYNKDSLIAFNHRFFMLELLFNNNPKVIISNLEDNNDFLGTLDSLKKLKENYREISFVIGSDNITDLDKWINYQELLENIFLIIIKRGQDDVNKLMAKYSKYNPKYKVIDLKEEGSSSLVRNDITLNKHLIDDKVYNYIIVNKLYESSD